MSWSFELVVVWDVMTHSCWSDSVGGAHSCWSDRVGGAHSCWSDRVGGAHSCWSDGVGGAPALVTSGSALHITASTVVMVLILYDCRVKEVPRQDRRRLRLIEEASNITSPSREADLSLHHVSHLIWSSYISVTRCGLCL